MAFPRPATRDPRPLTEPPYGTPVMRHAVKFTVTAGKVIAFRRSRGPEIKRWNSLCRKYVLQACYAIFDSLGEHYSASTRHISFHSAQAQRLFLSGNPPAIRSYHASSYSLQKLEASTFRTYCHSYNFVHKTSIQTVTSLRACITQSSYLHTVRSQRRSLSVNDMHSSCHHDNDVLTYLCVIEALDCRSGSQYTQYMDDGMFDSWKCPMVSE